MPKTLGDIYGIDKTDMASKIASDALSDTAGSEEFWAKTAIDQSAIAKGNTEARQMDDVVADKVGTKSDSRAKSQSNH